MERTNFVKFLVGDRETYNALPHKDDNALYFVLDDENPYTGALYLGDKLINSGGANPSLMRGATLEQDGEQGLVPAPLTTDCNFYLRGDGLWANPTAEISTVFNNLMEDVSEEYNTLKKLQNKIVLLEEEVNRLKNLYEGA